jgi:DNA polymerase/3'-5' exonuclease PolX
MEPIVNESNRLLYQAFVTISKEYYSIGEEYRSKALEKSSTVIGNYPYEITNGYELIRIPGIGEGTIRRINEFIRTGDIKIHDYEYTRAAAKRVNNEPNNEPEKPKKPKDKHVPSDKEDNTQNTQIDLLVPGKYKYARMIILKREYSLIKETEDYYFFG